ncbi:MAG: ABC transporter permease [Alphaproteobacteria bacterium]|nr:ABC transporter permease [Alphaproteobacteria bacterium]
MSASATLVAAVGRRRERSWSLSSLLLALPLAAVLVCFVVAPLISVVAVSVFRYDNFAVIPGFTLENYASVLSSRLTLSLYLTMIRLAAITWAVTLVLGFCVAYFLVFHVRSKLIAIGLFLACTVPFWTSNIIRMISWLPLLGRQGIINQALLTTGVIHQPLGFLLYSDFSVIVSYVHLFTIFMIVPIFNAMSRIDPALFEASRDAGASRWQTMRLVVLPLSKSGIVLGSVFVITLVMGDFYVVKVMSGGSLASVVSAMVDDISTLLFPHAAASAVILLVVLTLLVAGIMRLVDIRRELVAER